MTGLKFATTEMLSWNPNDVSFYWLLYDVYVFYTDVSNWERVRFSVSRRGRMTWRYEVAGTGTKRPSWGLLKALWVAFKQRKRNQEMWSALQLKWTTTPLELKNGTSSQAFSLRGSEK